MIESGAEINLPRQIPNNVDLLYLKVNQLDVRLAQAEQTLKLQDSIFRLKTEEKSSPAPFEAYQQQLEAATKKFDLRILACETKYQLLDVKTEIDIPQHILKMCAKVERRVLEKVEKERFFQELESLKKEVSLTSELCEGFTANHQTLVDVKLKEFMHRIQENFAKIDPGSLQNQMQVQKQETEQSLHSVCAMVEDLATMAANVEANMLIQLNQCKVDVQLACKAIGDVKTSQQMLIEVWEKQLPIQPKENLMESMLSQKQDLMK